MPECPIDIPSHTPGTLNINACPPPVCIPFSANLSNILIPEWPGIRSVKLEHIPINGASIWFLDTPVPYINALFGARWHPFLIISLLIFLPLSNNLKFK